MMLFLSIHRCYSFLNIRCSNKITLNIYCFPSLQRHTKHRDGGFSSLNMGLQPLVFLRLYQRWVMIHMLVRDGRRGPDARWPVREMWQRPVCRDKLESVACSSQSLQGLAETPTGSCLPSPSFISFSFTVSIFHVPSVVPSLFSFLFLLSHQPCQPYTLAYTWIFSNNSSSCFVAASISNIIRCLAEAQLVQLAHICICTHRHRHIHTHN